MCVYIEVLKDLGPGRDRFIMDEIFSLGTAGILLSQFV